MKNRIISVLLTITVLISFVLSLSSCSSSEYKPAMWVLEDENGAVIYFLGSIHIGNEDMYPLPDYVTDAYGKSDYLAVECDVVAYEKESESWNDEQLLAYQLQYIYTDGTTAADHMTTETYSACEEYFTQNGILTSSGLTIDELNMLHISLWQQLLTDYILENTNFDYSYGIDRHFLAKADGDGKKILEIESIESQTALTFEIPDSVYSDSLYSMVSADMDSNTFQYEYMIDLYKRGRDDLLAAQSALSDLLTVDNESGDYEYYNKIMLTDRNELMKERAKEYLSDGKKVFFVVGAAHMCGEGGIIQLLKNEGYNIKRVA